MIPKISSTTFAAIMEIVAFRLDRLKNKLRELVLIDDGGVMRIGSSLFKIGRHE